MIAYVYGRTDRRRTEKLICSQHIDVAIYPFVLYIQINNGYYAWTAMSNSHPRSLLASIFIKDQIKLKHLASYFHLFLPEYASNYFSCIHILLPQIIINCLFSSEKCFSICCYAKLAPTCGLWQTLDNSHYYIHLALDLMN